MRYTILLLAVAILAFAACAEIPPQETPPTTLPSEIGEAPNWLAGPGECNPEARPEFCTLEYMPVCGNDGETYGNACAACGSETVMTFEQGACAGDEEMQPPVLLEEYETQCDTDNRPEVCTREYMPVCGDDNQTYGNGCEACASETVFEFTAGECQRDVEEPVFCTQDAMQCPDGSFVGRQGPNCEFAPCPGA